MTLIGAARFERATFSLDDNGEYSNHSGTISTTKI